MTMAERMHAKLTEAFRPQELDIIDESDQHRGHGGWREGGETHFRIRMRADALADKTRVARQRAVYAVLKDEMAGDNGIHALALDVA
ncbi:MAG: BolA family protein [Pseudomonadota bacterium]